MACQGGQNSKLSINPSLNSNELLHAYLQDDGLNTRTVFNDCDWALHLNENSFKARLYKAKAFKELEEFDKLDECRRELEEKFPQHDDLIKYFLDKKDGIDEEEEDL